MISRDDLPETPDWQPEPREWLLDLLAEQRIQWRREHQHPPDLPERFELGEN